MNTPEADRTTAPAGEAYAILEFDLEQLAEGSDLEVKKASGRDGRGAVPETFFQTYSAMANTDGGIVLLGIEEEPRGRFRVLGIADITKVQGEIWSALNNGEKVSVNLLTNRMIDIIQVRGGAVIRVRVPRATRHPRPVFVGANPFKGTLQRNFEGDFRASEDAVKRMLAEQVEDSRDARLLPGFGLKDLDVRSLRTYRQRLKATKPDHPWLDVEDQDFLRRIGAWRRDRQSGESGLTLAGLLMFGQLPSILEAVPHYVVDYQERPEPRTEPRWIDRVTTDGTWSGNLFQFYSLVIKKLTHELKVPFRLKGSQRIDDSPVHEALREALVNTLIHADYSGRIPILVVKRPDMFGFRNPGTMRLPLSEALQGGTSDCRNRNIQKMFQLIGLGEQSGSGIPKIHRNWRQQHWRAPELREKAEPDQTLLEMRMVSLLPPEVIERLDLRFGPRFRELPEVHRLALVTVAIEGQVSHARLRSMSEAHPHDLTRALATLVRDGLLESTGLTRATVYFFRGEAPIRGEGSLGFPPDAEPHADPDEACTGMELPSFPGSAGPSSPDLGPSSPDLAASSPDLPSRSPDLDALRPLARPVTRRGKVPQETVRRTLAELCADRFLTLQDLADLLDRGAKHLQAQYLGPMVRQGLIELRYPDRPNHPQQAYRTSSDG